MSAGAWTTVPVPDGISWTEATTAAQWVGQASSLGLGTPPIEFVEGGLTVTAAEVAVAVVGVSGSLSANVVD